jgi:hypothetical protein
MRRALVIAAAALAAAAFTVTTAPAAAAKTVDVDEWAGGFCDLLDEWQGTTSKAHDLVLDVIDNGVTSTSKAKSTRAKIVKALDSSSAKSTSISKDVKALGTPDIANGAKISSTVSTAIADAADAFSDASKDAAHAPTDPKQFRSWISRISDHVDRDLENVGQDLAAIDRLDKDGELDAALTSASECAFLQADDN